MVRNSIAKKLLREVKDNRICSLKTENLIVGTMFLVPQGNELENRHNEFVMLFDLFRREIILSLFSVAISFFCKEKTLVPFQVLKKKQKRQRNRLCKLLNQPLSHT